MKALFTIFILAPVLSYSQCWNPFTLSKDESKACDIDIQFNGKTIHLENFPTWTYDNTRTNPLSLGTDFFRFLDERLYDFIKENSISAKIIILYSTKYIDNYGYEKELTNRPLGYLEEINIIELLKHKDFKSWQKSNFMTSTEVMLLRANDLL